MEGEVTSSLHREDIARSDWIVYTVEAQNVPPSVEEFIGKLHSQGRQRTDKCEPLLGSTPLDFYSKADHQLGIYHIGEHQWELICRLAGSMNQLFVLQVYEGDMLQRHDSRMTLLASNLQGTLQKLKRCGLKRVSFKDCRGTYKGWEFTADVAVHNPITSMFTEETLAKVVGMTGVFGLSMIAANRLTSKLADSALIAATNVGLGLLAVFLLSIWRYFKGRPRYTVRPKL